MNTYEKELNPDFQPTGQAGTGWYLCNQHAPRNMLELNANGSPIAYICLDIYEEGDFSDIEQAKANAQLLVNAHNLLDTVRFCEQALCSDDPNVRHEALQKVRKTLEECSSYSGPEVHFEYLEKKAKP